MTHVYFDSDNVDWSVYFRQQMIGQGLGMEGTVGPSAGIISDPKIFRGVRYTRGYGSVRNLAGSFGRFLLPIAQNIMTSAKEEAVGALGNIAGDLTQGRSFREAIKRHGTEAASRIGTRLQQCGKGKKRSASRMGGLALGTNKVIKRRNILRNLATMDPDNNPDILKSVGASFPQTTKKKRKLDYLDFN